jgi:hypothetical protein
MNLYNRHPDWLDQAYRRLDAGVWRDIAGAISSNPDRSWRVRRPPNLTPNAGYVRLVHGVHQRVSFQINLVRKQPTNQHSAAKAHHSYSRRAALSCRHIQSMHEMPGRKISLSSR